MPSPALWSGIFIVISGSTDSNPGFAQRFCANSPCYRGSFCSAACDSPPGKMRCWTVLMACSSLSCMPLTRRRRDSVSKWWIVAAAASKGSPSGRMLDTQFRLASVLPTRGAYTRYAAQAIGRAQAGPFANQHHGELCAKASVRFDLQGDAAEAGDDDGGEAPVVELQLWQQRREERRDLAVDGEGGESVAYDDCQVGSTFGQCSGLHVVVRHPLQAAVPDQGAADNVGRSTARRYRR